MVVRSTLGPVGRSRWAAIGAAVAIVFGAGGFLTASAATGSASVLVPIPPCRLMDSRPASIVGPRNTPIGPGETYFPKVLGTNGSCTIPGDATAVSLNVTIVNPTAPSYLTVFPADAPKPNASSLNWVAGQAPTPNAVTSQIGNQSIGLFNNAGSVDVIVDIVGYYQPGTGGGGPPGPAGRSALDPLPSGTTVTGVNFFDTQAPKVNSDFAFTIALPFTPAAGFDNTKIRFKNDPSGRVAPSLVSSLCSGTTAAPTAPPGVLCFYLYSGVADPSSVEAYLLAPFDLRDVNIAWDVAAIGDAYLYVMWAYTAP